MKKNNLKNFVNRISKKTSMILPRLVMFEITQRCNLKCNFCYQGDLRNVEPDMPIEQVFNIVDQLEEANCLDIILTGGEPLIRSDFARIYTYMKKKGFIITIFTNGTLITEEIADLFKEYPSYDLRISLYAGSSEGYESISGIKNAFSEIKKGVRILKQKGINFRFRGLIMKNNVGEFEKMRKFAKELGVKFNFRTNITATATRSFNFKKLKITPEQRDLLMGDDNVCKVIKKEDGMSNRLCNGAIYIANNGRFLICPLYRKKYSYDLEKVNIKDAYVKMLNKKTKLKCPMI